MQCKRNNKKLILTLKWQWKILKCLWIESTLVKCPAVCSEVEDLCKLSLHCKRPKLIARFSFASIATPRRFAKKLFSALSNNSLCDMKSSNQSQLKAFASPSHPGVADLLVSLSIVFGSAESTINTTAKSFGLNYVKRNNDLYCFAARSMKMLFNPTAIR